jgi:hypothetical protein
LASFMRNVRAVGERSAESVHHLSVVAQGDAVRVGDDEGPVVGHRVNGADGAGHPEEVEASGGRLELPDAARRHIDEEQLVAA